MGTYSRRCFSSLNDFGWCIPEVDSLGRKKKKATALLIKGIVLDSVSSRMSHGSVAQNVAYLTASLGGRF